ncbi:hypothetical protein ASD44_09575 [Mesorhizobium sp. Root554]|nr:hypothetical protein ASD27_09585 [Mesorhizobium sp. Root1471]KQZ36803.1 hypothetical protein ASD44_09575 [Mesorhizobium sp. Root554]
MARPTYGVGSSYWPTPMRTLYSNRVQIELSQAGLRFRDDPAEIGSQVALGKVAKAWSMLFLLMKACGAIRFTAMHYPCSLPLHLSLTAGTRYSPGDLIFNPNFSDWLMGWPIGWTAPSLPATEWSAWLRRMRGELSRLPMPPITVESACGAPSAKLLR